MNEVTVLTFWDHFSTGADWVTYISMIITCITLFTTVRIRKTLLSHVEKSDYMRDIDNKIKSLRAYEETLNKDAVLCNDSFYDCITIELDDIVISYENILPRSIISEIEELMTLVQNSKGLSNTSKAKSNCQRKLHAICTRLEKEKKLL